MKVLILKISALATKVRIPINEVKQKQNKTKPKNKKIPSIIACGRDLSR